MMIIQEENESPTEVSILRGTKVDNTKYIIVQNHVRELTISDEKVSTGELPLMTSVETDKHVKKKCKSSKKSKQREQNVSSVESGRDATRETEISNSDIEELRTVYKKCKEILNRIETKYGHLLNLENEAGSIINQSNHQSEDLKCNCGVKRKIIFDDDGQQLVTESVLDNHVCPKKLKRRHSDIYADTRNVQIEYEDQTILPDDLKSLTNILRDSDIELTYRNKVINRMRMIKQEHMNYVKFDRMSMVKKLKLDPDELLDFKGTNLSSLCGYPDWKP